MPSNARDEVVRFIYEVTGDKELAATAATMLKTGDAAEGASEDVVKFSAALKAAAAQSAQIQKGIDLQDKLEANSKALAEAKTGLEALNAEFGRTDKSSTDVKVAFQQAESAVRGLAAEQLKLQNAYSQTVGSLERAGINTANLGAALDKTKAQGNAAATALAKTAGEVKRTGDAGEVASSGIDKLRKVLLAVGAFVGLGKIKDGLVDILETGEKFDDLQKKFATAFGGLDAGTKALERIRSFAATVPQSFEDVSAAAIKLRQLGFDPLDGTLQALIDNQNALDQSQEDLLATIDALGKAMSEAGSTSKRWLP